jgi:hypothetical protein
MTMMMMMMVMTLFAVKLEQSASSIWYATHMEKKINLLFPLFLHLQIKGLVYINNSSLCSQTSTLVHIGKNVSDNSSTNTV